MTNIILGAEMFVFAQPIGNGRLTTSSKDHEWDDACEESFCIAIISAKAERTNFHTWIKRKREQALKENHRLTFATEDFWTLSPGIGGSAKKRYRQAIITYQEYRLSIGRPEKFDLKLP